MGTALPTGEALARGRYCLPIFSQMWTGANGTVIMEDVFTHERFYKARPYFSVDVLGRILC